MQSDKTNPILEGEGSGLMPRREKPSDPAQGDNLQALMEQRKATLDAMKIAYFHRAPFGDSVPDEHALKLAAEQFIEANYAYQKHLYGRVRVKLSPANLLR
jgi:hypothetical protein